MDWKTEFPEFKDSDMPEMPEGWKDISWHNDSCPSFEVWRESNDDCAAFIRVWISESEPSERDFPNQARFMISLENRPEFECLFSSDEWSEILAYVETCKGEWK